jgi:Nucleotidyl transferase AbiEii toxin, Type IV TA system
MLSPDDQAAVAEKFGVAVSQVRRDHLISHLLAALTVLAADQVVFFGGTALSRTYAPDGRLSEDIDLIATGPRRDVATLIEQGLPRAVRRNFPGLRWEPSLTAVRDTEPAVLMIQTVLWFGCSCSARRDIRLGPPSRGNWYSDTPMRHLQR